MNERERLRELAVDALARLLAQQRTTGETASAMQSAFVSRMSAQTPAPLDASRVRSRKPEPPTESPRSPTALPAAAMSAVETS